MKPICRKTARTGILAFLVPLFFLSCVNNDYDFSNLNTEVTLAGEGLVLPLGKTVPITMGDVLAKFDQDVLQAIDGGAYALKLADNLSLTDKLPDLKTLVDIPDASFAESFKFSIADIDTDNLTLSGQTYNEDFGIGADDLSVDLSVPTISMKQTKPLGIWEFSSKAKNFSLDIDDVALSGGIPFNPPRLPIYPSGSFAIPVDGVLSINPLSQNVDIDLAAPQGVTSITDIVLASSSTLTIEISTPDIPMVSGSLVPDMSVNLGGLFNIKNYGGTIPVGSDFTLSEQNSYKASKTFTVESLNLDNSKWDGNGSFHQSFTVSLSGNATLSNPMTTGDKMNSFGNQITFNVKVSLDGVKLDSFSMNIKDIEVEQSMDVPVSLGEISLPSVVSRVRDVVFSESSALNMDLRMQNLSSAGLDVTLETLSIAFPAGMDVEGAVGGVVTFSGADLISGMNEAIHLKKITLPDPVGGKISYSANASVYAKAKASGKLSSKGLPTTEATDARLLVDLSSNLSISDYHIDVNSISRNLDAAPMDFQFGLDKSLENFGTLSIIPEGSPAIALGISLPSTSLGIGTGAEGIRVSFPDFIRFKNLPSTVQFESGTNSIIIKGSIPESIVLPIDKISVKPVYDSAAGECVVKGSVKIGGSVSTAAGTISKTDVDAIAGAKVALNATIPTLKAASLSLEKFELDLQEAFDFTILKAADLPKELVSISEVALDNVKAEFALSFTNLPNVGVPVGVDATVEFPSILVLDRTDPRVSGNILTLSGTISDGALKVPSIGIESIDLSAFDFSAGKDLTGSVKIAGSIHAANPSVGLKDISGDITVKASAAVRDINFSRIVGKVDYSIEPYEASVKVDGLPDFLKDDNFVLDFANPYILLTARTNIGIPVAGQLQVVPVYDGVAGSEATVSCQIDLPCSTSASQPLETKFWLAQDRTGCPSDCNFIQANIRDLIRRIPDEIRLNLSAGTVKSRDCIIEPSADYTLDIDYAVVAPLEFGSDLNIELRDTVSGLPSDLGKIMRDNTIALGGEILNSLPLQLELVVDLLDEDNQIIPQAARSTQTISACATDGSASVSPLDIVLKAAADPTRLKALVLSFKVTSPNIPDIPVTAESFLQAELRLILPEGITLDIKDF